MGPQTHCELGKEGELERERPQFEGTQGTVEGPRGEILTPATMGGEQMRETVRERELRRKRDENYCRGSGERGERSERVPKYEREGVNNAGGVKGDI